MNENEQFPHSARLIRAHKKRFSPTNPQQKMVKVCIERVIDVPMEEAWHILSDFSHVYHIHPLVDTVDQITKEKSRGLGAIRQCNLYDGHKAVEKITEWNESKRSYVIELVESDLPMKSVVATLSVEDAGHGKSKLLAHMNLKAKFGLLGELMERLVLKQQLGGAIGDLFAGVEEFSKTGNDIQKGYKGKTPALISAC